MSDANVEKTGKTRLVRATVARGRTLVIPHPTRKRTIGFAADGKPIQVAAHVERGPGDEVELSEVEVVYYRKTGFLVDPTTKAPAVTEGATVTENADARAA